MGMLMRVAQSAINSAWAIGRPRASSEKALVSVDDNRGGWYPLIHEPFTGAWQRNLEARAENVASFSAAYACMTLIMSDIGKLRLRLVEEDPNGIWTETKNPAYSPVLRRPNRYQNRIQFFEHWMASKLLHGNTYVRKQRDNRNVVTALYILDPNRTRVLVADDGSVFYELRRDNLNGLSNAFGEQPDTQVFPASEIIHDRMNALYHPLCGISPITACALAASHGLNIQRNEMAFFANGARPAGILSTATPIPDEKAKQYQEKWNEQYRSAGLGGTAILGGEWSYTPMTMTAVDAQLIEQLKMTIEIVCSAFKVPPYMIGAGPEPSYAGNVEALNQKYYSQCLQIHTEEIEAVLDDGLGMGALHGNNYGTEFDVDDLLRMDTATRVDVAQKAIKGGGLSPNEVRKRYHGLGPVKGGEDPYLQQQEFSLSALAERDRNKPFVEPNAPPPGAPAATPKPEPDEDNANGSTANNGGGERRANNVVNFDEQVDRITKRSDALLRAS